jgi:hypothetical protein
MKNFRRIISLGAVALLVAGFATAGTITYSVSYGPATTDYSNTFTLSDFNPALGTLTGAVLTLEAIETVSSLVVANTSAIEEDSFTIGATSQITSSANTANAADLVGVVTDNLFTSPSMSLGPGTGTGAVGACANNTPLATCSSVAFTTGLGDDESKVHAVAAANLCDYVTGSCGATGTFQITATTKAFTNFSGGGGNIKLTQSTNAQLIASITYTYNPPSSTPEPATMFLMGSALVGVGLLRKRIKS